MCCLFGMMDTKGSLTGPQKARVLSVLSVQCEVRGTDATGIAYNSGGKLRIYKRPATAHKLRLHIPEDARVIMGHTRMTTQGSEKRNQNNHPFPGRTGGLDFALAHNGVLDNDIQLRKKLHLPKTKIQTDSYIAVQLLERKKALDLNSLAYMAEQVEGSFSFTVLDGRDDLYFVKGDNPLCIYRYPQSGLLLYASTEDILTKALKQLRLPLEKPVKLELACGDLAAVDRHGKITRATFNSDHLWSNWYPVYHTPYGMTGVRQTTQGYSGNQYVNELKSVAGAFGYSSEAVDRLLREGFTPEELEEYFYCGEL